MLGGALTKKADNDIGLDMSNAKVVRTQTHCGRFQGKKRGFIRAHASMSCGGDAKAVAPESCRGPLAIAT